MVARMMRAAKGEVALYEQVESTPSLTQEAYTIVAIVAVISAIGSAIVAGVAGGNIIVNALWSLVSTFLGYFVWAFLTYFIGTNLFKGTADFGELQRTLGYAYTPLILSFIPCVGFLAWLWSLYLGVVAVRQALDFDTGKAVMTAGAALVIWFVISLVIGGVITGGMAGLSAITGS